MTEQSRLVLMVLMLNEQQALGQLYTHSKGKIMQQNDYKAQWKITWYNIDETFNITATVQNEKHTCKNPSPISSIPCLRFWMCVI